MTEEREKYKLSMDVLINMFKIKKIHQLSLFKVIIVAYFIDLVMTSKSFTSNEFWGDDSELGFWAWLSFFMFSTFILFFDIAIILFTHKIFNGNNKRVYIFMIELIICVIVYFGIEYTFKNAEKWNEYAAKTKPIYLASNNFTTQLVTLNTNNQHLTLLK